MREKFYAIPYNGTNQTSENVSSQRTLFCEIQNENLAKFQETSSHQDLSQEARSQDPSQISEEAKSYEGGGAAGSGSEYSEASSE